MVKFPHEEVNGGQGAVHVKARAARPGRTGSSASTGSGPVLGDESGKVSCAI